MTARAKRKKAATKNVPPPKPSTNGTDDTDAWKELLQVVNTITDARMTQNEFLIQQAQALWHAFSSRHVLTKK